MIANPRYPFSDLTPEQFRGLMQIARQERAEVIRRFWGRLFARRRIALLWPARQREAQVWPPKSQPALSLTVYR